MKITETEIPDVKIIEPTKFGDDRGFFSEVYSQRVFDAAGISFTPCQDNHSLSAEPGTVRGLHFQKNPMAQAKLLRVAKGAILDVAVDIRAGSPTFGQHVAVELSAKNWRQLFVPAGFAHGFCTIEPDTEVLYKVDNFYSPEHDDGILWNDPALGIEWPDVCKNAILSDKDKVHQCLADKPTYFEYKK